ncbi:hypothetical protein PAXINDRAFT_166938 [Paxillus involutus ATCC 200175]|nr:hypothetical protein PAXINDRAFT_166938 [Paxillus involutus ATCC 200175]
MCQYLECESNVDPGTLHEFEEMIRKGFVGPGPYPTYILLSTKKTTPPPTVNLFASSSTGPSPSLSCGQQYPPCKSLVRGPPQLLSPQSMATAT